MTILSRHVCVTITSKAYIILRVEQVVSTDEIFKCIVIFIAFNFGLFTHFLFYFPSLSQLLIFLSFSTCYYKQFFWILWNIYIYDIQKHCISSLNKNVQFRYSMSLTNYSAVPLICLFIYKENILKLIQKMFLLH